MYIFTSTIVETIKTFCISILCSVIFSLMIYRDTVLFNNVVCFILNLAAFLLFLFLYYKNWSNLFLRTYTRAEFLVPAVVSFSLYCVSSTYLYVMKASNIYRWLFQQTRFLEPMLNREYAFISFLLAQVLTALVLLLVPVFNHER